MICLVEFLLVDQNYNACGSNLIVSVLKVAVALSHVSFLAGDQVDFKVILIIKGVKSLNLNVLVWVETMKAAIFYEIVYLTLINLINLIKTL